MIHAFNAYNHTNFAKHIFIIVMISNQRKGRKDELHN